MLQKPWKGPAVSHVFCDVDTRFFQEILGVCIGMDKISVVLEYESSSLGVWFPYISDSVKVSCQKCRKHSSWTYFNFLKTIPPICLETSKPRISKDEAPYSRIMDT